MRILVFLLVLVAPFMLQTGVFEEGYIDVFFCDKSDCTAIITHLTTNASDLRCAFYEMKNPALQEHLLRNGAVIIEHNKPRGLMHHKFCVINHSVVFTGSYNPGTNHKDNLIVLQSETVAQSYLDEIKYLQSGNKEKTTNTKINHNGYTIQNYFCPQDECQEKILSEIKKAEESIYFMTFTFTDSKIATAMLSADVEIKGIIENFQNKQQWTYPLFQDHDVIIHSKNYFQHNKIFIIDEKIVVTGSYNPTLAANTINDENIIIVTNPFVVNKYVEYFNQAHGVTHSN